MKQSYRNDIVRFSLLGIALGVFFIGPYFVQSDSSISIERLIIEVHKERKIPRLMKTLIIEQLKSDAIFYKQHKNDIALWDKGPTLSVVTWLSFLIILIGFGIPIYMKYKDNKKANKQMDVL